MAPQPRGPAASPPHGPHPPASDPSNPYSFPAGLWQAGKLPPKVTPTHVLLLRLRGLRGRAGSVFPAVVREPVRRAAEGSRAQDEG